MAISLLAKISNIAGLGKSLFSSNYTQVGDLVLDATYLSIIEYSSVITDHPIQSDDYNSTSSVSDHIYLNPLKIKIKGSINASPVDLVSSATGIVNLFRGNLINNFVDEFKGKSKRLVTAYEVLRDLHLNRSIIDVVEYNDVFKNMVIESLNFPRDLETGDRLIFDITLKQISYSLVETVSIFNNPKRTQDLISNKVKLGKQEVLQSSVIEKVKLNSTLKNLIGG